MKRFASTRSEKPAWQPGCGSAQCSVGSMDGDGMRYGFTTQALIASTAPTATTIVTVQSTTVGQGGGSEAVRRSIGPLTEATSRGGANGATPPRPHGRQRAGP